MSVGPAQFSLYRVYIAFVIYGDQVARRVSLWRTYIERSKNFESPAIKYVDLRGTRDIQEPLSCIRRERHGPCLKRVLAIEGNELLCDELALRRENLDSLVSTISDIHELVV